MSWRQFVMDLNELEPKAVERILSRHGALAITLADAGDDPVLEPAPGETPLWRETQISALFDAHKDLAPMIEELRQSVAPATLPEPTVETLDDRPWEREWLQDFKPLSFGKRLWVCPRGMEPTTPDAIVVRLDPGLAFGTGTHPTTALCLEYLASAELAQRSMLDFGSGSGILSIAALKLGAARVTATDIDHQAVRATRMNAKANGVDGRLRTSLREGDRFDLVVANILQRTLLEHRDDLLDHLAPQGVLVMSGILTHQVRDLTDDFSPWIDFEPARHAADWSLLVGVKRAAAAATSITSSGPA